MAANANKTTAKKPVAKKEIVQEQEVMTAPKKQEPAKPSWEIKDRMYIVIGQAPLTLTISSKHTSRHPLLYFDKEKGLQRELRYATNQNSPFIDEQNGQATLGHIMFKDGALYVKK